VDYRGRACKIWKVQTTAVADLGDKLTPSLTVRLICDNGTAFWRQYLQLVYLFKHVLQRHLLMIAYTDFIEGLQKYVESCNTASTKRILSLLFFYSIEHCHGYDDDYVSEHASNKLQMFASRVTNSSILILYMYNSHRHMHMISLFIKFNIRLMLVGMPAWRRKQKYRIWHKILYFCLSQCRQADQHQSSEVYSSCFHLHFGHAS